MESSLPLLRALQKQIMPSVRESGLSNIVVALSTWREMQNVEDDLPAGASIAHKPLRSKRVLLNTKKTHHPNCSTLLARWPQDGLTSSRVAILMFVIGGKVAIPLGDYVLRCVPYQGALILPGTPHPDGTQLCLDDADQKNGFCDMLSFRALGDGVWGWINHSRGGRHWGGSVHVGEGCYIRNLQARKYLETLTGEAQKRSPYFREMCDDLARLFITLVLREIQEERSYQPPPRRSAALALGAPPILEEQSFVMRVEEYVHENLHESISIDSVASYLFISRTHLTRKFREMTGKTLNQYITECRIEAAKVLLQSTEWPINKISAWVGITPARLRVLFQQHERISPGDFRRQLPDDKAPYKNV